ncbi:Signal transduction histidine kinase [Micromonospora pattaloongensis]|uniref:histidine kinase n=1 Tax=Micromonospora pattaloongensis TaxID=405436 RepID=A0A1H3JDZ5_9ACTN|nr:nitrate- and nitrite sensing domain-containing protein [Micromonospora pattaloongensis]SDY37745.1 Signal transduction histidine kinase [Micromonospora pattaloongensis]
MIPMISLLALWGFATYLTVGDGYRLLNQGRLITEFAAPAEEILGAIQGERRDSMVFLADPSVENRTHLIRSRTLVDQKVDAWRSAMARDDVQRITPERVMRLARVQLAALDGLAALRSDVDGRSVAPVALMAGFTDIVDPITPLYAAVASFPDDEVSAEGRALQRLAHARELRARADAVLANALAARGFTDDSYVQFVQAVGLMRAEYHEAYVQMTGLYRREMDANFAKEPYPWLARMENAAIATGGAGRIPVDANRWREQNAAALAQLSDFQLDLAVHVEEHAKAPAYLIFARILVAALIGLIAVVATVLVSVRIARRLANRLRDLSADAHALADTQLPAVVDRLRHGEEVDVEAEAPVLRRSADEIGEVGDAFNTVRRTAIATAVEQAQLRAGIRNVFLNIARRSQTLVKKQLGLLDVMERKTVDPEELADLFQVDHLATRMRRYAENLVILGGGRAGRNWGKPVGMQEVLRGAASEAEHYERVRVLPIPPVLLDGAVVSDVIHLVAELIDNATAFSPPHTTVQVSGQMVPHGFAIEVDDRGLGMSETDLAAANGWLTDPPEFNVLALSDTPRLGMFVVARIASRHGIRVSLRQSPYGGITAIVLVPPHLVAEAGAEHRLGRDDAVEAPTPAGAATGDAEPEERVPVGAGVRAAATGDDRATVDVDTVAVPVYTPPLRSVDPGHRTAPRPPAQRTGPAAPSGSTGPGSGPAAEPQPDKTHLGLPVRVRQARLAPGLRDATRPTPPEAQPLQPARSPEEIRRMMSAYQRGTARGRGQITDDADLPPTPDSTSTAEAGHADEES